MGRCEMMCGVTTSGPASEDPTDALPRASDPKSAAPPAPTSVPGRKDPHAVALGRRGGLKGGPARAEKLSPERRSEIARQAAAARWGTKHEQ